jgi:arsenate reductase-like glutaredoxin family protein
VLSQAGIPFVERELFRQPLSVAELRALIGDRPVADFFAWRSPRAKALGLQGRALSEEEMLELMSKEPALIRRPLVQVGGSVLVQPDVKRLQSLRPEAAAGGPGEPGRSGEGI